MDNATRQRARRWKKEPFKVSMRDKVKRVVLRELGKEERAYLGDMVVMEALLRGAEKHGML